MSEKRLVVDQLKFTYEGLFDLNGLYRVIDSFFYEKGYDRFERINSEQVTPTGKQIRLEKIPWKSITDYFKLHIKIRLHCNDVKTVEVEKEGASVSLQQGQVLLVLDGYLESDRRSEWERRPIRWFIRTLFDKYIFKGHYGKSEQWLVSDIEDLYGRIKSYLNVNRGAIPRYVAPGISKTG